MVATSVNKRSQLHHVLIVEDERISRHALATLFRHSGYVTQEAASAEEAIGILSNNSNPEFAIIDIDLPGMNGVDLADYLTSHMPSVHSVLVTASDLERLTRLLDDHPFPFLQKPVNFTQLLHLLEEDHDKLAH